MSVRIHGVDFTSAPRRAKPVTVATLACAGDGVFRLQNTESFAAWDAFEAFLRRPGPWIAAFDFPFGLPRELVLTLAWPTEWTALMHHLTTLSRADLRNTFKAFCDARPVGNKFAHRASDIPAGASSSMKWVNPPVAYMLHAGAPRLLDAGVHIPGLHVGDLQRVALEGYPGMLARAITRASYKSDTRAMQTPERRAARVAIVDALEAGAHALQIVVQMDRAQRTLLIEDGSGDCLDALLCAVEAAWAWQRRDDRFGLPAQIDPLEGWIVAAGLCAPATL